VSSPIAVQPKVTVDYLGAENATELKISVEDKTFISATDLDGDLIGHHHAWWHSYVMGNHIDFPYSKSTLRVGDLFCGPGGLSQGVSLACRALGFKTQHQLAVDVDREALRVFSANHRPKLAINDSTASLVSYTLRESNGNVSFASAPVLRDDRVAALQNQIDLLIAGPPCQGHSTANSKRKYFDNRNLLYLTVPAIAVALGVPIVIIENVPGVRASQQGVVQSAWKILENHGYTVTGGVLNAADMGWAQARRRYFMIAVRDWTPIDIPSGLIPALKLPPMPISDLLSDLVDVSGDTFMTELPELSDENRARIDLLHDLDIYDLPDEHRNQRAREIGTTYRSVYGRMYWDKPAQTITTGFMTPGRGRYVHPIRRRTLLPLEAARLQGFPDTYVFDAYGETPKRASLAKWIGDAVPAPLGFAAGVAALALKQ
jgi:DNA (cytosine-5)-methyltransferase 1